VRNALLDTGALVAIVNRRDRFHATITGLLKAFDGRFLTTWPVIAEACSFMPDRVQMRVLDWMLGADRDFLVFRLPDRGRFSLVPGR